MSAGAQRSRALSESTSEPLAFYRGQYLPASQAALPFTDAGFVQGTTVAEQLRTFRGRLFRLEQHLHRLGRSLQIVGVQPDVDLPRLAEVAKRLVSHNRTPLAEGDDLGLTIFVTPGIYPSYAGENAPPGRPTVGLHTQPLPFHLWKDKYQRGESLVVTEIHQVPEQCWPAELKCRSRMHYYLADRQAHRQEPGARALLLDQQGMVTETSTANIVIYDPQHGLVSPPREHILPGISAGVLAELAEQLGIAFVHRQLRVADVAAAEEVMLCSTSPCIWPVLALDGQPIGTGKPGPIFQRCLRAWSELVGVDIAAQAERFARR